MDDTTAAGEMTFPILKVQSIVNCLAELNIPITPAHIKEPQPAHIRGIYETIVETMSGANIDAFRMHFQVRNNRCAVTLLFFVHPQSSPQPSPAGADSILPAGVFPAPGAPRKGSGHHCAGLCHVGQSRKAGGNEELHQHCGKFLNIFRTALPSHCRSHLRRHSIQMMHASGVPDFSLADIHRPTFKRVKTHLSALINLCKFWAEQHGFYQVRCAHLPQQPGYLWALRYNEKCNRLLLSPPFTVAGTVG